MSLTPPVPRGPGVQAPFPTAPVEGSGARLGWALGIAGAAFVLCCGGGAVALLGFGVTQVAAIDEQSRVVVTDYLDALRDEKYDDAYKLLCDSEQSGLTRERFAAREKARGQLDEFEVGEVDLNNNPVRIPVVEHYRDGAVEDVYYEFANDSQTGQLEICGRE